MSVRTEPETASGDPLGVATRILVAQIFILDRLFFRVAKESALNDLSRRHMSKALKAQNRCRMTFGILHRLRAAAEQSEKFSTFSDGTIQTLKTPLSPMAYRGKENTAIPSKAGPTHKILGARKRWSAERRARQAAAIREWQPWQKSTGPRTQDGKARSAGNALKHGHRSKAYIEMRREDRRILHLAAENIAIAKLALRSVLLRRSLGEGGSARAIIPPPPSGGESPPPTCSGVEAPARSKALRVGGCSSRPQFRRPVSHRIGIGRARPALVPFARKFSGNRGLSGLPPADNAALRRRWRLARHDEEDVTLKQG